MNLEDFTPFTPAMFISGKDGAGYTATVLLKAAFAIQHGRVAEPLEEQFMPAGDTFREADGDGATSLSYATDFVPYKTCADVLVTATAYRPASRLSGVFPAAIRVGTLQKRLAIFGRRQSKRGIVTASIEEVEQLAAVPVIYESAFGGPADPRNPVGQGLKSDELPLIEYFDQQMQRPGDKPTPAGFGPISADWEPRKSMIGTFGSDYVAKHWPGFPADFNPRYFNAAPADQQIDGYLRGDEEIELENLHRSHPRFITQLPGWRAICVRENESGRCELIPLVIDTLSINADLEQLVLIWRGRTPVRTPDALEIKQLGFLVERLVAPLNDASYYQAHLQSLIKQREAEFELESPQAATEPTPATPVNDKIDQRQPSAQDPDEAYLKKVEADVAAIRTGAGCKVEPEPQPSEPPPLSPEAQAKYNDLMAELEKEEREQAEQEASAKWTRDKVVSAVRSKTVIDSADLSDLDLSDCELAGAHFRRTRFRGASFSRSNLTRAVFEACLLQGAKFDATNLDEAQLEFNNLQDASLAGATLRRANLAAADLTNARLDHADLSDAQAERAILTGASLGAGILTRANLSAAVLSAVKAVKADFSGAVLVGAVCDQGDFVGASFRQADLRDANFAASRLNGANFDAAVAADADFTGAELDSASFRGANCDGMWLSSAKADRAVFRGASCVDLQLDGTSAKHADFGDCCISSIRGAKHADLSGANFQGAHGTEPIFETCRLDAADFSYAAIPGANFAHASLIRANLTAADLNSARFDYANCEGALFVAANLFEAVCAGVNLNEGDISDANFYGAEFLDAHISNLRVSNSNLKMTKLEAWAANKTR